MAHQFDIESIVARMVTLTESYLERMEAYSLEQLHRKPGEEDWSLGQMYLHLIQSALYMQFRNIELCRRGDVHPSPEQGKTEAGAAIIGSGSFPPIRIKVPATKEYTPGQPESKDAIRSGMAEVLAKLKELAPVLSSIPSDRLVEHPRLGFLNAVEWFALTEMHYRHHLLQQERLEAFLAQGS